MTIIAWIVLGLIAGWLAGVFMRGNGFGLVGDVIVGVIGAFIGAYVFRATGAELGVGPAGSLVVAFAGAILLLFVIRLFLGRRSGRRSWS